MQQTLLVTVQGTRRRLDIELPGNVPVQEIIPLLLDMCNHPARFAMSAGLDKAAWTLQVDHLVQPLQAAQTLSSAGVLDGDVLLLQERNAVRSRGSQARNRDTTQAIKPSEQTGMIGVEWEKF